MLSGGILLNCIEQSLPGSKLCQTICLINHSSPRLPIYKFASHAATAVRISITHTDEVIPNCTAVALSTPTSELKTTARHKVQCLIARPFRLASSQIGFTIQPVPSLHHCSAATSGSILIPFISRPNPCNLRIPIPGVTDLEDSWRIWQNLVRAVVELSIETNSLIIS
jgi:hypothetical protein